MEILFMAWQNLARYRGRFVLTVLSLFLGAEAFLGAVVITDGRARNQDTEGNISPVTLERIPCSRKEIIFFFCMTMIMMDFLLFPER